MEQVCETLILSDLHLGSDLSRAHDALHLLRTTRFKRLILLGDIFADLNFGRLKKEHWQFLGHIRKLSNPKRNIEVVWVEGNHDQGLTAIMSHLVGVEVFQEYRWRANEVEHLAIHGHQFDRFIVNNALLSGLTSFVFLQLQKLDTKHRRFTRLLDKLSTRWLRLDDKVARGAVEHARRTGAQRVFCGHTHSAMREESSGIEYLNTGCWTQGVATYVTIDDNGAELHTFGDHLAHAQPFLAFDEDPADAADGVAITAQFA